MPTSTRVIIITVVALGILLAGGYMWWSYADRSIEGFYEVSDGFVDSTTTVVASVRFVQVEAYDSLKMLRVAEHITRSDIEEGHLNRNKTRDFLYHFYVPGDTQVLTDGLVDELAYTHPEIANPREKLVSIPSGWVVRATFAPSSLQPKSVIARQSNFYMPRHGISAKSLR